MVRMDKLKHFALMFIVTMLLEWEIGVTVALTIEFTQAESGNATPEVFLSRVFSADTIGDFIADTAGIIAGLFVRILIF